MGVAKCREHASPPNGVQHGVHRRVLQREGHVALSRALVQLPVESQRDEEEEQHLHEHRVRAHVEADLRPALRVPVHLGESHQDTHSILSGKFTNSCKRQPLRSLRVILLEHYTTVSTPVYSVSQLHDQAKSTFESSARKRSPIPSSSPCPT